MTRLPPIYFDRGSGLLIDNLERCPSPQVFPRLWEMGGYSFGYCFFSCRATDTIPVRAFPLRPRFPTLFSPYLFSLIFCPLCQIISDKLDLRR